jgi:hypothetical protein
VTNFNEPPADDRGHQRLAEIPVESCQSRRNQIEKLINETAC